MEVNPILSTPKLEISWKELSVLLKCCEVATPLLQTSSTLAHSLSKSTSSRRLELPNHDLPLCPTPTSNQNVEDKPIAASVDTMKTPSSVVRSRRRSFSRSPAVLLSSSRMARLEQSEAARKLLDSISPDIFVQHDALGDCVRFTERAAKGSPTQVRTPRRRQRSSSSSHKTQSKLAARSSARNRMSSAVRSISFNSLTPPRYPNSSKKLLQSLSKE